MAAETLRSELLCTLTGFVAPPRDIGTTPRGTRRFFPAIGGSFAGPRLRGEVHPTTARAHSSRMTARYRPPAPEGGRCYRRHRQDRGRAP